jgi:hypothetical protein
MAKKKILHQMLGLLSWQRKQYYTKCLDCYHGKENNTTPNARIVIMAKKTIQHQMLGLLSWQIKQYYTKC